MAVLPGGQRMLSGSQDKTLRLWDLETGATLRTFTGHTGSVYIVALSPDGRFAVSGGADKTIRLWDVERGRQLYVFPAQSAPIAGLAFTPDGRQCVSGGHDKTVRVWNLPGYTARVPLGEIRQMKGHGKQVDRVVFAPAERKRQEALSVGQDCLARLWDVFGGLEVA